MKTTSLSFHLLLIGSLAVGSLSTVQAGPRRWLGNRNGTTTWQNNRGTGEHTFANTYDPATKSGTHTGATTYANGKTTSSTGTYQGNGDGTGSYNGTFTGGQGKTSTTSGTVTKTSDGYTVNGTATGPNGKTATYSDDVSHTLNSDGSRTRIADRSATGQNGKTKKSTKTTTRKKG